MTQPTLPFTSARRTFGNIRVDVDATVDGGWSINTFAAGAPHRYDELSFITGDLDIVQAVCGVIGDGGNAGVKPEGIAEAVRDELAWLMAEAQRRRDTPSRLRVESINLVLDQVQSPADRALLAELGEALRSPVQVDDRQPVATAEVEPDGAPLDFTAPATKPVRPLSGFGRLQVAYADAAARDRAERAGRAA